VLDVPYSPDSWNHESVATEVVGFVEALDSRRPPGVELAQVREAIVALELASPPARGRRSSDSPSRR
jgi:hypothetical protein